MYKKNSEDLIKHIDFIILDIIVYCFCFWLAYVVRHRVFNMFANPLYVSYLVIIILLDIFVAVATRAYKGIIHRGYLIEFRKVLVQSSLIFAGLVFLAFLQKVTGNLSRTVLVLFYLFSIVLVYLVRCIRKKTILRNISRNVGRKVLLVSDTRGAKRFLIKLSKKDIVDFDIKGIVLLDQDVDRSW